MLWVIIIILAVLLDQASKYIIVNKISFGVSNAVIDNFFYLTHWRNKGAAWGILQNAKYFFIPATIIVSIGIGYYLFKSHNKLLKLSLSFILGGAVGNLIDRVFKDGVVDFLEFHFGSYQYPVFNVADSFVVIGAILLSYYLIFIYKDK